ncbi:AAA family ATPase [Amycolatopsis kentuckyensis]|uniref:AAA family ATPase n=1 Tax=Amycolatopsis kentuckyensis TaxID=218823 RepID=UPI000A3A678C|nr:AAA family ATPase [Amycolatopsis kentuckyensis]
MLDVALAWHAAGCSVGRARIDGSKAPMGLWKPYQSTRATITELQAWFNDGHPGIGIFTGAVSGDLEMYELEGRAIQEGVLEKLTAEVPTDLWQRITTGYLEVSAGGGIHVFYRVEGGVAGNTKLAQRPARDDELTDDERHLLETKGKRAVRALIETRGEGGWCVIAPSHGPVHPNGKAWATACKPENIPTITAAERDLLHAISRSLDQMPPPAPIPERKPAATVTTSPGDLTPGEDFCIRGDWRELLEPHGWTVAYVRGNSTYWTRPGKSLGVSAVTGGDQGDFMYVYTTSSELPSEAAMAKWRVYAYLEHGGDFSAAAAELRRLGYGTDRPLSQSHADAFDGIFGVTTPDLVSRPAEAAIATQESAFKEVAETPPAGSADGAGAEGEAAPGGKFLARLYSRNALRNLPRPEPLIEDTLDLGTVAMLFGYWGSMKSFVALDWAGSIATGRAWQGRKVCRPGRVLYIAAEGAHGLNGRLEAWEQGWQTPIEDDRLSVLGAAPSLGNRSDVAEVCALVAAEGFTAVVVDTFAKCITGMDENSSRDIGVAVESLYRIQAATNGGSVVAVHHTGKDRVTSRGSSALEAGVDTAYLSEKIAEGSMRLERTKRKDGATFDELHLQLSPVDYTESCVLELQSGSNDAGLERQMAEIMTVYRECFSNTGCSKKELLAATMMPEPHFWRGFNALLESGQLNDVGTAARPHYKE